MVSRLQRPLTAAAACATAAVGAVVASSDATVLASLDIAVVDDKTTANTDLLLVVLYLFISLCLQYQFVSALFT